MVMMSDWIFIGESQCFEKQFLFGQLDCLLHFKCPFEGNLKKREMIEF
jgi:hypothetical protein